MKKSILNLGKALNKVEQKFINGGAKKCRATCLAYQIEDEIFCLCP